MLLHNEHEWNKFNWLVFLVLTSASSNVLIMHVHDLNRKKKFLV